MLSRRNIRTKVLQQLYALNQQESPSVPFFAKQLENSFTQFYQFYYFQLNLLDSFNNYLLSEKDIELQKYFPNKNQIRNTECIQRLSFYNSLEKSNELVELIGKSSLDWSKHGELLNKLFENITQYQFFIDFNVFDEPTSEQQKEFLINFYEFIFNEFELFESIMEDIYSLWADDSADILKGIIKTIENYYQSNKLKIEKINDKQREDFQYGNELFQNCVVETEKLDNIIAKYTANWDPERLTLTDTILMRMALSEFLYFETIPPKVTINEYMDIAKAYSTPKSHIFLNGVLDKMRKVLTDEGKLIKTGRGLIN